MDKRHFVNKAKFDTVGRRIKKQYVDLSPSNNTIQSGEDASTFGLGQWYIAKDENEARWAVNSNQQTIFYVRFQFFDYNSATNGPASFMHALNLLEKTEDKDPISLEEVQGKIYAPTNIVGDQFAMAYFMPVYRRNEGLSHSDRWHFEPIDTIYKNFGNKTSSAGVEVWVYECKRVFKQTIKNFENIDPGSYVDFLNNMIGNNLFLTTGTWQTGGATLWNKVIAEVWYYESGELSKFQESESEQYP